MTRRTNNMNDSDSAALSLPPVSQIGFVVRDLEQSIARYQPIFGEFVEMSPGEMDWEYRGKTEPAELKIAFGKSGDVEIELIEWVSGECPHKEFIEAGHEGMQHLRFLVDDVDAKVKEAEALGYQQIWYKRFAEGLAASYLEKEGDPLIVELFENSHG
ncbi:hypothetical protein EY643_09635 [Halioglobus maricola]|uniref:VOC domain-containing protein n=2 Tax=Halioglobus maricola TaxID=2601894 RepID=A0A5P9NJK3_9GAMM|nr:hypothetical protein EY643_09635 [Halioglobus maricola]